MKLLISTIETQGQRKNDFSFTLGGELVMFGSECDGEMVDGHCGCRRSMTGIESRKGTTTMKVVESRLSVAQVAYLFSNSQIKAGFFSKNEADKAFRESVKEVKEIARIAGTFPNGAVLEKRGNTFQLRRVIPLKLAVMRNEDPSNGLGLTCLREVQ